MCWFFIWPPVKSVNSEQLFQRHIGKCLIQINWLHGKGNEEKRTFVKKTKASNLKASMCAHEISVLCLEAVINQRTDISYNFENGQSFFFFCFVKQSISANALRHTLMLHMRSCMVVREGSATLCITYVLFLTQNVLLLVTMMQWPLLKSPFICVLLFVVLQRMLGLGIANAQIALRLGKSALNRECEEPNICVPSSGNQRSVCWQTKEIQILIIKLLTGCVQLSPFSCSSFILHFKRRHDNPWFSQQFPLHKSPLLCVRCERKSNVATYQCVNL